VRQPDTDKPDEQQMSQIRQEPLHPRRPSSSVSSVLASASSVLPERSPDETDEQYVGRCAGAALLAMTAPLVIEAAGKAADGAPAPLPRFSMVGYTGGPMRLAWWKYPVIVDLAGLLIPTQNIVIRESHAARIGHADAVGVEDGKLVARGVISCTGQAARDLVADAKNGFPWQASIGSSVEQFEFVQEDQTVLVNGREFKGPVNVVRRATLGEISFVDIGADRNTSAKVAAANKETIMAEDKVKETAGTEAPAPEAKPKAPAVIAARQPSLASLDAQAAELRRVREIEQLALKYHREAPDALEAIKAMAQDAIDGHCTLRDTDNALLRLTMPKAPDTRHRPDVIKGQTLAAAVCAAGGLQDIAAKFSPNVLEEAHSQFHHGLGLEELILVAAQANGFTGRNVRSDMEGALRAAFNPRIEAGMSTVDLGGIVTAAGNKFLLEGFMSVERTWRNICSVRNVKDFKTVTSYRMIGRDQYELVAPGGELKHGALGNESYTNKADTYGLQLVIDRRDIINDDLGAITTVPRKLGRGSGLKINDIFWTIFMNNGAFFLTANKNYMSGAGDLSVLNINGLTAGEVLFNDLVDADGKPTGIIPAILLVPTALTATASALFKATELRDNVATNKYPTANPHQGKFRVETSRYLANIKYTGYSATAWYLLADPKDLPVIEVAFLNGQESPTIETAQADFNVLGIRMRGYHDFGVALQDPKGGIMSKGAA
jgi:hypothetical protein